MRSQPQTPARAQREPAIQQRESRGRARSPTLNNTRTPNHPPVGLFRFVFGYGTIQRETTEKRFNSVKPLLAG